MRRMLLDSPRERRLRALLGPCLGLVFGVSCGGEGDSGANDRSRPGTRWIELARATAPSEPIREPTVIRSLEVPEDVGAWLAVGAPHERVVTGSGASALAVLGEGTRHIAIPGPFESTGFNRIVLRLHMVQPDLVTIRFVRAGEAVLAYGPLTSLPRAPDVAVDLVGIGRETEPFDALWIDFEGHAERPAIVGIDLVSTPRASHLLPETELAAWGAVGDDRRLAWTLLTGRPLQCTIEPQRGERLDIEFGVPFLARLGEGGASLSLTLEAKGLTRAERWNLPGSDSDVAGWVGASVDLSDFVGGSVRVRLDVVAPEGSGSGCLVARPALTRPLTKPARVLFVTSDTHRADYVGASRSGVDVQTPHLDELAARGVFFENGFSTSNLTLPSHAAMLTGVHPTRLGLIHNWGEVAADARTLAEVFRDFGFTTIASVSTNFLHPGESGLGQGFARFASPTEAAKQDAVETLEWAARWLDELADRPVFAWVHLYDAHEPYGPPDEFTYRYYPSGTDPFDPELPEPPRGRAPRWMPDVRDIAYVESMYRGEVTYLDERLGEFLARPDLADGIVAVTADHGESLGQHNLWFTHRKLYPQTLHVPLILAWPGAPAGTRVERAVINTDVGRTLLDLAGLEHATYPGANLIEQSTAETATAPRFGIGHFRTTATASVDFAGWFLQLQLVTGRSSDLHKVELYDRRSDPACERDLVERHPDRAARLRAMLVAFLASRRETEASTDSALDGRLWALGYGDGSGSPAEDDELFDPECACDWCARFR